MGMESKYHNRVPLYPISNNQESLEPSPNGNPVTRFALQAYLTGEKGQSLLGEGPIAAKMMDMYDRGGRRYPTINIGPFA